jgi:DNA-binding MarR family transcriptional regulator
MRTRLGLGDDELTTLLYLAEHAQLTQRELIAISTLTRSGVGAMVHRLEEANLIERVPDPDDGRVRLMQLTPRGTERLREASGASEHEVERLLADAHEPELEAAARLVSAVADAMEQDARASSGTAQAGQAPAPRDWRRWG